MKKKDTIPGFIFFLATNQYSIDPFLWPEKNILFFSPPLHHQNKKG